MKIVVEKCVGLLYNAFRIKCEVTAVLFRKKMPKCCEYCRNGTLLEEEQYLCIKHGVVQRREKCRKFKYDPCKRVPSKPKAIDFQKYDTHDFSL